MDIKDLFKSIEGGDRVSGTRSYILLERLVSRLLSRQAEEQGKPYQSTIRMGQREIDGIAPEGIDNLPGPTLVEIKVLRNKRQIGILKETFQRLLAVLDTYNFASILFVAGNTLTRVEENRFSD